MKDQTFTKTHHIHLVKIFFFGQNIFPKIQNKKTEIGTDPVTLFFFEDNE